MFGHSSTFSLKNSRSNFSDDRDMKHNDVTRLFITCDQVIGLVWESCREPNYDVVAGNHMIIGYPINFANEINKLLDNLVILNPFGTIFSDEIPDLIT